MWTISKINKIRDQGMEIQIFMLRLKIYIWVMAFKMRMGFLRFEKMTLFEEFVNSLFDGSSF